MQKVNLWSARKRNLGTYSGGMKQRAMIAMALAGEPELLIADEPTTALDVTIQAQVLELMRQIQQRNGMAILLITHDLGVVAEMAQHVAVMYAGEIVEMAPRNVFFNHPAHPYTQQLFASLPGKQKRDRALTVIQGQVPSLAQQFTGCRFVNRCNQALPQCRDTIPQWHHLSDRHQVRCHLYSQTTQHHTSIQPRAPSPSMYTPSDTRHDTLLRVTDLAVHFPIRKGLFKRIVGHVKAVDEAASFAQNIVRTAPMEVYTAGFQSAANAGDPNRFTGKAVEFLSVAKFD